MLGATPQSGILAGGTERTVFELVHPTALPPIPDHSARGYQQRVLRHDGRRALVEVIATVSPLESESSFPIDFLPEAARPYLVATTDELLHSAAQESVRGVEEAHTASARLLDLTAQKIQEPRFAGQDSDPAAGPVWRRGNASCVGRSNVAVALHRAAGLPARTVHGIRWNAKPGSSSAITPQLLHRWTEVFLPDRGWVPSDPGHSIHYITSSYLLLALGEESPREVNQYLAGLHVRVLQREGSIRPVDRAETHGPDALRLPKTPNRAERWKGAVLVEGKAGDALLLTGPGGSRDLVVDANGEASFLGLSPGLYRLQGPGRQPPKVFFVSESNEVRVQVR